MNRIIRSIPAQILLFVLILFNFVSFAQAPNWLWAKGAGGPNTDVGHAIAVDGSGNSYVTGWSFSDSISFGNTTLINADIFVVKYGPAGNVLWAKSPGGAGVGNAIAVDSGGNSYVTGYFSNSISFDTTILTTSGYPNVFVAKYDPSGNVLWAKSAGGTSIAGGNDIAIDKSGNIYITGDFRNDSVSFGSTTLISSGGYDMFVVKYDSSGNVIWAKGSGAIDYLGSSSIGVDMNGNCFVTGHFRSNVSFGGTMLTNPGPFDDIFIVKYDSPGNVLWAKSAGGSDHDYGRDLAIDGNGNCYLTGIFYSPVISFGGTVLTNTTGYQSVFVVKYDPSGNVGWAKAYGGTGGGWGSSIAVDLGGNNYAIGSFLGSSISFGSNTLMNAGGWGVDIFVVKHDSSGNVKWAQRAGGTGIEDGQSIAIDGNGHCYVTGDFLDSSSSFGSKTLTNAGGFELFIAKLDASPNGIEELQETGAWKVYPNPVKDILHLKCNSHKAFSGMAQIYDYTGRKVLEKIIDSKQTEINMQHLPAGLYLLKAGETMGKLIKE